MYKQGAEGLMLWKKRWFALSEFVLYYHRSPDDTAPSGSIPLPSYKISPGMYTLFESENEWQKTEQVPIPLPRASRNFPYVKMSKVAFLIVIQLCYNELWPFSH